MSGAAEIIILLCNEFGVFGHENLSGSSQIKAFGMLKEIFTMDARPNQTSIGVDVDLGYAQFSCLVELGSVHALGAQ